MTPAATGTFAYVLNCSTATGSIAQSATLTVNPMAAVSRAHIFIYSGRDARLVRTDLVADVAGARAVSIDANLADPWGLVLPEKLPAVVASRESSTSTSYDGLGVRQPASGALLVRLPAAPGSGEFGAASVVANSGDGFVVSAAGTSAPARLLYAGRSGVIAGWSPEVDASNAVVAYAAADSAAYTALAIATSSTPSESRLYATDFRNSRIDVFDGAFRRQTRSPTKFAFTDAALPPGYAPFGIAVIGELVYVTYAQRLASSDLDPRTGAGLGLVAVFTTRGDFITRLITTGGVLNAPWAIVRAPEDSAIPFSGALLIGNSGDGRINAFDAATGALLGSLSDGGGAALVVPRLHGLAFGNHAAHQPPRTLFFTAGAHQGANGWYGRIDFSVRP